VRVTPTSVSEHAMAAEVAGHRLAYLLSLPPTEGRPAAGWPLLFFLHGGGERGDDLALVRVHGPPKLVGEVPELARCVLLAPQCPAGTWWRTEALKALVDEVRARVSVDASRIYVTGMSMGGYATWHMLASYPELFAAAVPICGGGDPQRLWSDVDTEFDPERLRRAKDVPVRAFHGEEDDVVPVEESRVVVRVLLEAGADVELTVYPGVGHDSWTRTYAQRELYAWLFAQRRRATASSW
jgi:predicted peptidase